MHRVRNQVANAVENGAMAFANWYIAFHFPTATWVNFKVWGGIGLFVAFAIAQGLFLARHVIEPSQ